MGCVSDKDLFSFHGFQCRFHQKARDDINRDNKNQINDEKDNCKCENGLIGGT